MCQAAGDSAAGPNIGEQELGSGVEVDDLIGEEVDRQFQQGRYGPSIAVVPDASSMVPEYVARRLRWS